mmetsp:Transcript_62078/g.165152  ORF Transcript_62078/g.165152 Transcript_62078/m.165152 type:complete len:240 (-) Transcript_62078:66-785(-)
MGREVRGVEDVRSQPIVVVAHEQHAVVPEAARLLRLLRTAPQDLDAAPPPQDARARRGRERAVKREHRLMRVVVGQLERVVGLSLRRAGASARHPGPAAQVLTQLGARLGEDPRDLRVHDVLLCRGLSHQPLALPLVRGVVLHVARRLHREVGVHRGAGLDVGAHEVLHQRGHQQPVQHAGHQDRHWSRARRSLRRWPRRRGGQRLAGGDAEGHHRREQRHQSASRPRHAGLALSRKGT